MIGCSEIGHSLPPPTCRHRFSGDTHDNQTDHGSWGGGGVVDDDNYEDSNIDDDDDDDNNDNDNNNGNDKDDDNNDNDDNGGCGCSWGGWGDGHHRMRKGRRHDKGTRHNNKMGNMVVATMTTAMITRMTTTLRSER